MTANRLPEQGFVIVSAIFLLVILSALGAFMLSFSNTQQLTSAQDVLGSRAQWAARSGVQWAVSQIKATSDCASPPTALEGFNLTITCPSQTHDEGGVTKTVFAISSVATTAGASVGSIGYIERSISATVVLKAPGVWDE